MDKSDNPLVTFGTGIVCGVALLAVFILIAVTIDLRPGFYGFSSLTLP